MIGTEGVCLLLHFFFWISSGVCIQRASNSWVATFLASGAYFLQSLTRLDTNFRASEGKCWARRARYGRGKLHHDSAVDGVEWKMFGDSKSRTCEMGKPSGVSFKVTKRADIPYQFHPKDHGCTELRRLQDITLLAEGCNYSCASYHP